MIVKCVVLINDMEKTGLTIQAREGPVDLRERTSGDPGGMGRGVSTILRVPFPA